ncbi:MAG: tetratricopeptide repeat protein [Acidobacteria bacterium]|nr:tetratricopeptide repeat protein [Acidobacteriota bacterium]
MLDWLKPLLMMFYAPARGMALVRERAPLGQAALVALVAYAAHALYVAAPTLTGAVAVREVFLPSAWALLAVGLFFVPIAIFVANLFERRASFPVVVQQEYAALASTMFYGWAAASIAALPLAVVSRVTGLEGRTTLEAAARGQQLAQQVRAAGDNADPRQTAEVFAIAGAFLVAMLLSPSFVFTLWATVAVREVFRFSWLRAALVVLLSGVLMIPATFVMAFLLSHVLGSPFLMLLMFFLLRGYFGDVVRTQRARASFRQNLEAATLNPADASAHYNLGLIHLSRKELDPARERFHRAVEIDADEVDAHYQLGRISRMQSRLPEAIRHFEQVVSRDDSHAQHEVWREIGATYLAAGQYSDALDALERFLARRESDAEGLYLKGRALAGLGRQREADEAMRACIEAVKTSPAYKYRTDKRWLNEAQQFLRSRA